MAFARHFMDFLSRVGNDNISLVAAGVAFYAMLSIFPAIAAFISIYGLAFDPNSVKSEIGAFAHLLPANSFQLITTAIDSFASNRQATLNVALAVSTVAAIWSAKAGMSALMTGLNIANEVREDRSFLRQQAVALLFTLGAIGFAIVAVPVIAVFPAIQSFLFPGRLGQVFSLLRWPALAVVIALGLMLLYRFGPARKAPQWKWITWGATTATVLWIGGSSLFSIYIENFASYDATYGSLAAPVVLLLWFWLSAAIILIGAEIDAMLETTGTASASRPQPDPSADGVPAIGQG